MAAIICKNELKSFIKEPKRLYVTVCERAL